MHIKEPRRKGCRNLIPGGEGRRTILRMREEGMAFLDLEEIYDRLWEKEWPYTCKNYKDPEGWRDFYHVRDRGLGALAVHTCGRINELLRITRGQFRETSELDQYKDDPELLILTQFYVSKRKKGGEKKLIKIDPDSPIFDDRGNIIGYRAIVETKRLPPGVHPTPDIPLPRVGRLAPFTELVEDYLEVFDERYEPKERLFKFSTSRGWDILNTITGGGRHQREKGLFPHWFRSQALSYNVNLLRSATIVARQKGIDNPRTIAHYYRGDWVATVDEIKGVKK